MKTLLAVKGNSQKLDGGAMFGNAPKAMWQNWVEVDEQNRIDLTCRGLLIKEPSRNVLLEVGIGAFFEPKLRERFGVVESHHVLLESLAVEGLTHEDIDVIILSHLHFDHAGGLLNVWQEGKEPELLFPNATIYIGKQAWERANKPHPRDKASFIPQLQSLLQSRDKVVLIDDESHPDLGDDFRFFISNGHTPGMMLTEVMTEQGPVIFCADLIPGEPWVHLPITMGYDRFPEQLIDEKNQLLSELIDRGGYLFFTHDPVMAVGQLKKNDKGRFCVIDSPSLLAR